MHTHTRMLAHTRIGRVITDDVRQSAHLLAENDSGVKLKFKGWLNIIAILRARAYSR